MKRFLSVEILVLAFFPLLFSTGCSDNGINSLGNPPVVSAQQTYSNASLSGTYSFNEIGVTGTGVGSTVHNGSGTLQFDGNGNVTGTITDYYIGPTSCQFSIVGTYSVASSASGTANLTSTTSSTGANCVAYTGTANLQVGQQGQSLVYAESDGQRLASGTALKQ